MVVVTLVLASAGEDGTVSEVDDETVATGGVVGVCDMVGLAVETLFGLVFDEVAFTVVVVAVGEDVEVGFGEDVAGPVARAETLWVSADVEDTVAGAEDTAGRTDAEHDKAESCCKSFTAEDLA